MNAVFFQHPSPNCVVFHFEDNDKYSLENNKAEGARSITHDLIKRQNVKFYTLPVPGRLNVMTPEKQRNQINSMFNLHCVIHVIYQISWTTISKDILFSIFR